MVHIQILLIEMYSLATLMTFLSESKLGSFWTTFLDIKKQLFVSDKFLNFASEEGKTYFGNVTTVKKIHYWL